MSVKILSLCEEKLPYTSEPPSTYIEVTFRIDGQSPEAKALRAEAKKHSQGYYLSPTIDDIEPYLEWLKSDALLDFKSVHPSVKKAWVFVDRDFQCIDGQDTFKFADYVAQSSVTKAVIDELKYFQMHNHLSSKYRHNDDYVVLSLILTLSRFWD
jgi:hypothetical protein